VVPEAVPVEVELLTGGVSADVFMVVASGRRLVVKRALGRLRVREDWRASPARVLREAAALSLAKQIRPDNVPAIVDLDEEQLVLTIEAAPPELVNWKVELLAGSIDDTVGRSLGMALADWHSKSWKDQNALEPFADGTNFFELRISPFFHRVAQIHTDLGAVIGEVATRLASRSVCLVHGDFSPKNVLTGGAGLWVLDWETAHCGDPTFDVAFLVSHLLCKAIHRPECAAAYRACSASFVDAYLARSSLPVDPAVLVAQVGCLVIARVDGTSPVDYFDDDEAAAARVLGRRVLLERPADLASVWSWVGNGRPRNAARAPRA
jgi:5-methylthioribose kinase